MVAWADVIWNDENEAVAVHCALLIDLTGDGDAMHGVLLWRRSGGGQADEEVK